MASFKVSRGLQTNYNSLQTKDSDTVYFCTDTGNLYLGSTLLFESNSFTDVSISGKVLTFTKHGVGTTPYPTKVLNLTDFATTTEVSTAISTALSSVLVYKGSCTYANLPSSDQKVGDCWNVTDAHESYPAGTNYAWDGTSWDALGGIFDTSNFKTKQSAVSDPSASGTSLTFIDSISQNANGEITPTKKTVASASSSSAGLMSSSHYSKLEAIESGAQVNVLEGVSVNGTDLQINSKKVNLVTNTAYDPTTNKLATMSDLSAVGLDWGSY